MPCEWCQAEQRYNGDHVTLELTVCRHTAYHVDTPLAAVGLCRDCAARLTGVNRRHHEAWLWALVEKRLENVPIVVARQEDGAP